MQGTDLDRQTANPDQVLEAARPAMEEDDRRHERELLDRLRQGVATGGRGAASLRETLEALAEQRVETLLVDDGYKASVARCPACGWLGVDEEQCRPTARGTERRGDVVEDAVERALGQSADIWVVRHHEDLHPLGGIGAVMRF